MNINKQSGPNRKDSIKYIAVIMVVIAALALLGNVLANQAVSGSIPILLTDPPHVPNGTTALTVTYNGVAAHYVSPKNGSGWISATGSGTLNLMELINVTQTIASLHLTVPNATVDRIKFNVTSAAITLNGNTYNVLVSQSQITANVSSSSHVSGSNSILIDLSPTVAVIYTDTSAVFVMVPSVKAIVVPGFSTHIGARSELSEDEKEDLDLATPKINITGASLTFSGNTIHFSVTVKDNSNQSVVLRHVLLYGGTKLLIQTEDKERIEGGIGASADRILHIRPNVPAFSISDNVEGNSSLNGLNIRTEEHSDSDASVSSNSNSDDAHAQSNEGVNVNSRADASEKIDILSESMPDQINISSSLSADDVRIMPIFRVINFMVRSNGTLALPFIHSCNGDRGEDIPCLANSITNQGSNGYTLAAGHSVTLTFTGKVSLANGKIIASLLPDRYRIVVTGEEDAHASAFINGAKE